MAKFPVEVAADERCPYTSGLTHGECCRPFLISERAAPTARALMRSRFTAFAIGDASYLRETWHADTRPDRIDLDPSMRWYRLDIESASGGTPFERTGEVVFTAHYRVDGTRGTLHERSRFVRDAGRWYYVDGDVHST
nr:YchJ family metal-binding protein [Gordonia soli]